MVRNGNAIFAGNVNLLGAMLTWRSNVDTVPGYLVVAALMARIRNRIGMDAARIMILSLAFIMISQGPLAQFAAAQSIAGCHNNAAAHAGGNHGAHEHDGAGHSHDDTRSPYDSPSMSAAPADIAHDHASECCGWMCTALDCMPALSLIKHVSDVQLDAPLDGTVPNGLHAFFVDRPPRSQSMII